MNIHEAKDPDTPKKVSEQIKEKEFAQVSGEYEVAEFLISKETTPLDETTNPMMINSQETFADKMQTHRPPRLEIKTKARNQERFISQPPSTTPKKQLEESGFRYNTHVSTERQ